MSSVVLLSSLTKGLCVRYISQDSVRNVTSIHVEILLSVNVGYKVQLFLTALFEIKSVDY